MSLEDCVWHHASCQLHPCNMQVYWYMNMYNLFLFFSVVFARLNTIFNMYITNKVRLTSYLNFFFLFYVKPYFHLIFKHFQLFLFLSFLCVCMCVKNNFCSKSTKFNNDRQANNQRRKVFWFHSYYVLQILLSLLLLFCLII